VLEAIARGLWENHCADKETFDSLLLEAEGDIEDGLMHQRARRKPRSIM
jgi:hypothetical protein